MPPKRTRAAQPRSTRAAASSAAANSDAQSSSKASRKVPSAADDESGDSDAYLITNRPSRTARRSQAAPAEDYTMTGALADGDAADAHRKNVRTRGRTMPKKLQRAGGEQAKALEALKKRKEEAAKAKQGKGTSPAPVTKQSTAAAAAAKMSSPAVQRTESPARGRRRTTRGSTPPQQAPGTVQRGGRALSLAPPPSAVKAQGTPSVETSVLALSKFKRRKRQPSLLRMMQQHTSDVENNDDSIEDSTNLTLDYSLGDFEPDHESTPLNLRRPPATAVSSEPRTLSSRKRKLADREREEVSEVQVLASSPPVVQQTEARDDTSEHLYSEASDLPQHVPETQQEAAEEEAEEEEQPAEEDEEQEEQEVPVAVPESQRETRTARRSSSTSPLSSIQTLRDELPPASKRQRGPARRSQAVTEATKDDVLADPVSSDSETETETPIRRKKTTTTTTTKNGRTRKTKPLALSTATLQSLLPRRNKPTTRTRNAGARGGGVFEIPSSDEEDDVEEEASGDEDELQRAPTARRGGRRSAAAVSDSTVRGKKKKGGAAATAKAAATGKKGGRLSKTYGRQPRLSSDKENQDVDGDGDVSVYVRGSDEEGEEDEVMEGVEGNAAAAAAAAAARKKSKELEKAVRKFAEVDEWEMEFESVDMGGASASSPWR